MDPISLAFLGVSLVSGVVSLFGQHNANQEALAESSRQIEQAKKDEALMRLKNDAEYILSLRKAEVTRQASAQALEAKTRQTSIILGLVAVASLGISLYLILKPAPGDRSLGYHN